ncbi:MAG: metal ABC transporter permease [Planctomycetota bacterium]|nr:metal ABC transporter permease [Planctomycetota bacterium]
MNAALAVDLPVLAAALLATLACGTLGNWLVLRKESMTGDAIAHAVLPGLVAGFLVTGTRSVAAMFIGAAIAGAAAVVLSGVLLLESQGARQVDLDPECVLFGSLETLFYAAPADAPWHAGVPAEVWTLAGAAALAAGFSIVFGKELASLAFDPAHARLAGAAPRFVERMLLAVVSAVIVASFAAVGSVLVLALLVCPALIAAPHARSVRGQILLSVAIGSLLAAAGYLVAAHADEILGTRTALNSAGMIATLLALAVPCSHLVRAAVSRRSA